MQLVFSFVLAIHALVPATLCLAGDSSGSALETQFIVSKLKLSKGPALIVGCDNPQLAVALAKTTDLTFECIDNDEHRVAEARKIILEANLYGTRVSADVEPLDKLAYPQNCFNLILSNLPISEGALKQIYRVLSPNGVALLKLAGGDAAVESNARNALTAAQIRSFEIVHQQELWLCITKEFQPGWDEWTHRGHDAGNTFSSRDTIDGPGFKPQWIADYRPGSVTGAVALAGGRVVIASLGYEEAPDLTPYIQVLDAFTGQELWARVGKKELPITRPAGMYSNRESCSDIAVVQDALYLLAGKFCQVFDLKTGTTQSSLPIPAEAHPADTDAWLYLSSDGSRLFGGSGQPPAAKISWDTMHYRGICRAIFALSLENKKVAWTSLVPATTCSICVGDGKLFFVDDALTLHALDSINGTEAWKSPAGFAAGSEIAGCACYNGKLWVLYNAPSENPNSPGETLRGPNLLMMARNNRQLEVFDAKSGQHLFRCDFSSEIAGFTFYGKRVVGSRQHGVSEGGSAGISLADVETGKLIWTEPGSLKTRCTPTLATMNLLMRRGNGPNQVIQSNSIENNTPVVTNFIGFRSSCSYPAIPAYGMLFVQGEGCGCQTPIRGNIAMTSGSAELNLTPGHIDAVPERLKKGEAYGATIQSQTAPGAIDWSTGRADLARSATTSESPALPLKRVWSQSLSGILTNVAVAQGKVFAGSTSRILNAFDLATGKQSWQYIAPGEITVSPFVWEGRVLFGDAEGWAHSLRADNGAEIWSYRASLGTERMLAYEQLVSRWPAWSGVVVHDGIAYVPSGFFPDEQTAVTALDAVTGEIKWQQLIDSRANGFRGGFVPKGEMVVTHDRIYIPTGVGQPWYVPLKARDHRPATAFGVASETSVKAEQIMAAGDDLLAVAPHLRYTHHVKAPGGSTLCLPIVSNDAIYFLNEKVEDKGRCLVSVKKEMFGYKMSADYATYELKKEHRNKANSEYLVWSAWSGQPMTTMIKSGDILFSGGPGKVYATNAATGQELWSENVTGTVTGLAFSAGHLVIVTDHAEIAVYAR